MINYSYPNITTWHLTRENYKAAFNRQSCVGWHMHSFYMGVKHTLLTVLCKVKCEFKKKKCRQREKYEIVFWLLMLRNDIFFSHITKKNFFWNHFKLRKTWWHLHMKSTSIWTFELNIKLLRYQLFCI